MQAKFLFLGTGGSAGIPMIGCGCDVCRSLLPQNKRHRAAGLLKVGAKSFLIDVGPEFRIQALNFHIDCLSAVLLTHAHADHIGGVDDLRAYYFLHKKRLPCILSKETFDEVQLRYHYLLKPLTSGNSVSAQIDFQVLPGDFGEFEASGVRFKYVSYFQLGMKVTGFLCGHFAYVSDIRHYSHELVEALQGVDVLVLSALRHRPTQMHFSVDEAIAFARRVGAKKTYLTHLSHELEHAATAALLPSDVLLSYDGLEIPIEIPDRDVR